MNDDEWLARRFEADRPRLEAVAFRMLGSSGEAEDAVQEAWFRLASSDTEQIVNLSGWLTTVVGRVCLDQLRRRKARAEQPMPEHGDPVPLPDAAPPADPESEVLMADSVGLALLIVLEALEPAERLAFVLHDMFAVPFDEIARILDRTPVAARKLASRARARVRGVEEPQVKDVSRQRKVVEAFLGAARAGDFDALVAVLNPEVTLRTDGMAGPVIRGAAQIAGSAITFAALAGPSREMMLVDGKVAVVSTTQEGTTRMLVFTVEHGLITGLEGIGTREPLRGKHLTLLED